MGAFGGAYAEYAVYLDGEEKFRSTYLVGQKCRFDGAIEETCKLIRASVPGKLLQIVKHLPKQGHKDKIIYTWRRVNGEWRIAPKHLQFPEAPP